MMGIKSSTAVNDSYREWIMVLEYCSKSLGLDDIRVNR